MAGVTTNSTGLMGTSKKVELGGQQFLAGQGLDDDDDDVCNCKNKGGRRGT
jgi:hypothetical protein